MDAGIHRGMDRETYDSVEALNQSTIKVAHDQSLSHARWGQTHPSTPSDALIEGNALHTLILEPSLFDSRYAEMPVNAKGDRHNRRTKAGENAWNEYDANHGDKWPLKPARIAELHVMKERILLNPLARTLIENAVHKEISFFWEHPEYGFPCKGQADLITHYRDWSWVIDVKSAVDAAPTGFSKAIANYGYMIQGAWYLEGLNEIAEADRRFGFIAFEKKPPYEVGIYELDPLNLFEGRHRMNAVSKQWALALETGAFPGYSADFEQSRPQSWAMTHEYAEPEEAEID